MVSEWGIKANPEKVEAILHMAPPQNIDEMQKLTSRVAALNRFVSRSTNKCPPFSKYCERHKHGMAKCDQAFKALKEYLTNPPLLN